jgi:hypothetical protein
MLTYADVCAQAVSVYGGESGLEVIALLVQKYK